MGHLQAAGRCRPPPATLAGGWNVSVDYQIERTEHPGYVEVEQADSS